MGFICCLASFSMLCMFSLRNQSNNIASVTSLVSIFQSSREHFKICAFDNFHTQEYRILFSQTQHAFISTITASAINVCEPLKAESNAASSPSSLDTSHSDCPTSSKCSSEIDIQEGMSGMA
ncbi:hypothetical protein MTR_2g021295 [Medicago truncatula]|uniref:Transmembrane protein n=1 Tax=Medicago truncatula TaxID=3880 RepID=A0A072V5W5_MEDTR|nr:hypothetical protein MTR_2g021295 [Medicago truncatula]